VAVSSGEHGNDRALARGLAGAAELCHRAGQPRLGLSSVRRLQASIAYDPPGLPAGDGVTTSVAVPGAALGDFAQASFSSDLQSITLTAWVSAADTVSLRFQNDTANTIDLGSGILRVRIERSN
jgi:hypothetical protein